MELHLWSGLFAVLIVLLMLAAVTAEVRDRFRGWRSWRPTAFALGGAVAVATVVLPLDRLGEQSLLTAHVAQHVLLADLAAPLLLLGLPLPVRRWLRGAFVRLGALDSRGARLVRLALSPIGAFVLWAAATYVWIVPALHRLAVPDGPVHLLDHLSFLAFGLLIWLGAFDPRAQPAVKNWEALKAALRVGGLPWWARHVYAMVTRLAMLPAAFAIWLASESAYYRDQRPLPFGISRDGDQERAASIMIGYEMVLAGLAVVLAFIFVSISEGRARAGGKRS